MSPRSTATTACSTSIRPLTERYRARASTPEVASEATHSQRMDTGGIHGLSRSRDDRTPTQTLSRGIMRSVSQQAWQSGDHRRAPAAPPGLDGCERPGAPLESVFSIQALPGGVVDEHGSHRS